MKIIPLLFLMACGQPSNDSGYYENADVEDEVEENGHEDGVYCAEVGYYYSVTGTQSTYILEVEIEDEELTVIRWPNGGWLDNDHITPSELDKNGTCTVFGEEGKTYEVELE